MNFKFTKWKTIVSLIVLIVIDIILASMIIITDSNPTFIEKMLRRNIILDGLLMGLIAYVIWSLFEKKS